MKIDLFGRAARNRSWMVKTIKNVEMRTFLELFTYLCEFPNSYDSGFILMKKIHYMRNN